MYKKQLAAGFLALMMLGLLSVSALAHGGHGRSAYRARTVSCAVCTLEDCETAGRHLHDGVTYCGYAHADGICNGQCRALCTLEDCTLSGSHSHDGTAYCGYAHECGFCDGSCQAYYAASTSGCGCHGHHGHC